MKKILVSFFALNLAVAADINAQNVDAPGPLDDEIVPPWNGEVEPPASIPITNYPWTLFTDSSATTTLPMVIVTPSMGSGGSGSAGGSSGSSSDQRLCPSKPEGCDAKDKGGEK